MTAHQRANQWIPTFDHLRDDKPDVRAELEALYAQYCNAGHASSAHLPTLRALAAEVSQEIDATKFADMDRRTYAPACCAELGTKHGASAVALLLGCAGPVYSVDIAPTPRAQRLAALVPDRWHYIIADSRTVNLGDVDLLFVDAMHNYEHVRAELDQHADRVRRYLVFHDTITFGSHGAIDESGKPVPGVLGIRPAIDELMIRDPRWKIVRHDTHSHGLLVLRRHWPGEK